MVATLTPQQVRLAGGVVACDDEPRLARAVRSLLRSRLPDSVKWSGIWIIVSPSRDRTVAVARELARQDYRIHLIEETARRGKSAALARLFTELEGDYAVLLNGDAEADPLASSRLLAAAPKSKTPFAVMARPIPERVPSNLFGRSLSLLWELHHRLHLEMIQSGRGTHVSDELLLIPLGHTPPLAEGIINDGAFIGSWVTREGGQLAYAPSALVRIAVPSAPSELIEQRRRIRRGHDQIRRLTGSSPTTLDHQLLRDPVRAARIVWAALRNQPRPVSSLTALVGMEVLSATLATVDWAMQRATPYVWTRVRTGPIDVPSTTQEPISAL